MKKLFILLTCLFLCFTPLFAGDPYDVLGGSFKLGLAIWGFSTGGGGYIAVSASIFAISGTIQLVKGLSD